MVVAEVSRWWLNRRARRLDIGPVSTAESGFWIAGTDRRDGRSRLCVSRETYGALLLAVRLDLSETESPGFGV